MSVLPERTPRSIWTLWLHFNVWSFLLLILVASLLGWAADADTYKERSEVFLVDVLSDTLGMRENRLFPQVWVSEFQGVVAGRRRYFAILFYPGISHRRPTMRHEKIYAVINVDEFAALGSDADHPVPVLKYGASPAMENFDYGLDDVNRGVAYDVYDKNVTSYLTYNKDYWGVSLMDVVHFLYLWISLPWGLGCGVLVVARRVARTRTTTRGAPAK